MNKYHNEMRPVVEISNLPLVRFGPGKKPPLPLLEFLSMFLGRVGRMAGIEFFAEVLRDKEDQGLDDDIRSTLSSLQSLGVVRQYQRETRTYPDEPIFHGAIVNIAGRRRMGHSGYGKSLFSPTEAWWPAIGEAIERWSIDHFDVSVEGRQVLTPADLKQRFGYDLLDTQGFSVKENTFDTNKTYKLQTDTMLECVVAENLISKRNMYAPLQWFSFKHARRVTDRRFEPVLFPLFSNGAATGRTRKEAELRAMLEIIERDVAMIHWHNGIIPRKLPLADLDSPVARRIKEISERYGLETYFLHLRTDFPALVVQAIIIDRTGRGPAVLCDSAADISLDRCLERSFLGAIGLRSFVRKKMDNRNRDLDVHNLDMESRALWWSRMERLTIIDPYISGEELTLLELEQQEQIGASVSHDALIESFRVCRYDVFSKIVTSEEIIERTGLMSAVVKIPAMMPIYFDENERFDRGSRMSDVPRRLGLKTTDFLQSVPHPYA